MYIRWLGAFGFEGDLEDSIEYELSLCPKTGEVKCAEWLKKGQPSVMPSYIRIGLLVRSKAVRRKFSSDVYSKRTTNRRLIISRPEGSAFLKHTEAWVRPDYIGLVLRAGGKPIRHEALAVVTGCAKKHNLPIFKLNRKGELLPVRIREDRLSKERRDNG